MVPEFSMITVLAISYPPLLFTVFFTSLIVIWLLASLRQRYRTISLSSLASELKLRIFARDPLSIPQRYDQLYLFKHGYARRARNVMIGHYQGRPIRAFDYLYETGLGIDRRTQRFSVVIVQADRGLPALLVHPINPGLPQYNMTGLEEILLPEIQQRNYLLFCEQDQFARDSIPPEIVEKLKNYNNAILELCDGILALYLPHKLKPTQYRQLMTLASELTEQLTATYQKYPSGRP